MQGSGSSGGAKIGLWDEISQIAVRKMTAIDYKKWLVKFSVKINYQQKLTVLFAAPLRIKQREGVLAVAGQKLVCGMRNPRSQAQKMMTVN